MGDINRIIIFGATGNTGLCCVQSAVELGLEVTTFVRDASKIPEELQTKVNIIVGDTNNAVDVEDAVQGQDAVVIALGTGVDLSPTTLISDGTKNALSAMMRYNIKRISACLSAFVFREPSEVPEKFIDLNEDHKRALEALRESNCEWVAVLPPHIADIPATGCPVVTHGSMGPSRVVSKHDLGRFLVESLMSGEHLYEMCGICSKPESKDVTQEYH